MNSTSGGSDQGAEGSDEGQRHDGVAQTVHELDAVVDGESDSTTLEQAIDAIAGAVDDAEDPSDDVAAALQRARGVLGQRIVAERRADVRRIEERSPIRARLLAVLAERPGTTPGALAVAMQTNTETISRALAELRSDDLVFERRDPADGRRRPYWLSGLGLEALKQHLAHGSPPPPRRFTAADDRAVRQAALAGAVADRREQNDLATSAAALERVLARSREAADGALEVQALRELVTTLRQDHLHSEARARLDELRRISEGQRLDIDHRVLLAATAHQHYESGRLLPFEKGSLSLACFHLFAASVEYRQLEASANQDEPWTMRRGWAIVSVADNLRQQTLFGRGLDYALEAERIFTECEDPYGIARSTFLAGFCSRLRGDFPMALEYLDRAAGLNQEHGYRRFTADTAMQRGEVLRSLGHDDEEAIACLREAQALSDEMGIRLTATFARSAEGAVHFARGELDEAAECLDSSLVRFTAMQNVAGRALNLRRLAEVGLARGASSTREDIDVLLAQSAALYEKIDSPAGRTACAVAQARSAHRRKSAPAVKRACQRVAEIIRADRMDNNLLCRDPWVPALVDSLVVETGNEDLGLVAAPLLEDARSRDVGHPAQQDQDRARMAAEPRRNVWSTSA